MQPARRRSLEWHSAQESGKPEAPNRAGQQGGCRQHQGRSLAPGCGQPAGRGQFQIPTPSQNEQGQRQKGPGEHLQRRGQGQSSLPGGQEAQQARDDSSPGQGEQAGKQKLEWSFNAKHDGVSLT